MTIQNFDRQNLKQLRADMDAALAAVQAKHGITISLGNMRFSADRVKVSVEANTNVQVSLSNNTTAAPTAGISTALQNAMTRNGVARTTGRKGETLTGYNPNRPKYPFSYQTIRGTRYKASIEQAQALFGRI